GLTLAAMAIWRGFGRKEVRLFTLLAIASLLYAMAHTDALYGLLYVLAPLVEKAREPIVALFLFHFAVAALAAIGAEIAFSVHDPASERRTIRILIWFGGVVFGVIFLLTSLKPVIST